MCGEVCGDNRFEIIERVKRHLLDATNIKQDSDEWQQVDSILFRLWQLGEIGETPCRELERRLAASGTENA